MANPSINVHSNLSTASNRDFKPAHRVSFTEVHSILGTAAAMPEDKQRKRTPRSSIINDTKNDARDDNSASEEDPWVPKYTLCLDGGGIRGYSTLLIIKRLMDEIRIIEQQRDPPAASSAAPYVLSDEQRQPPASPESTNASRTSARKSSPRPVPTPKSPSRASSTNTQESSSFLPCHYFDYIAGTSTGGLIAIMLSRLRMPVEDCIGEYQRLGETIFGQSRRQRLKSSPFGSIQRNTAKLQELLREMVETKKSRESEEVAHFASSPDSCRTIVVALKKDNTSNVPYLFRTYEHPVSGTFADPLERNPGPPLRCSVWEVARATSATPSYFKPMKIQSEKFVDGGLAANNPTWLVLNELGQMHGSSQDIDVFLSIGAGQPSHSWQASTGNVLTRVISPLKGNVAKHSVVDTAYIKYERFDVENIWTFRSKKKEEKLWRSDTSLDDIRIATIQYLDQPKIMDSLRETAKKLVTRRRLRAETARWESFVFGVRYLCQDPHCKTPKFVYRNRDDLIAHMQRKHNLNSPGPDNIDTIQQILEDSALKGRQSYIEPDNNAPSKTSSGL